ncbi:MAG: aquaporin [Bacteroidota bacterium]
MNKYLTEFIGTFFLVGGAIHGGAVGASLALMVMVYAGGHISGAHYNPAVTLAVWIRGRIEAKEAIVYWIFQVAGAVVAALIAVNLFEQGHPGDCAELPASSFKSVVAELLGTFALAYVVLNVATAKLNVGNSFYGLAIGGTVLAMATALGKFSGGAFNPAVAAGLCVTKAICWQNIWVYLVGCLGGGALAAIVFKINNPNDK